MKFQTKIGIVLSILIVGGVLLYLKTLKLTYTSYTVKQLYEDLPLNQKVEVKGRIVKILRDYTSRKGNIYQRFYISSGNKTILSFCLIDKNRLRIVVGDKVRVRGTFIRYRNFYEIFCKTSDVEVI